MVVVLLLVLCGYSDVTYVMWFYCSGAVVMLFVLYGCIVVVCVVGL